MYGGINYGNCWNHPLAHSHLAWALFFMGRSKKHMERFRSDNPINEHVHVICDSNNCGRGFWPKSFAFSVDGSRCFYSWLNVYCISIYIDFTAWLDVRKSMLHGVR